MRFDPPPIELTPDLRWMLLRAFGPTEAPAPPGGSAACVQIFRVGHRIGHRIRSDRLSAEARRAAVAPRSGALRIMPHARHPDR